MLLLLLLLLLHQVADNIPNTIGQDPSLSVAQPSGMEDKNVVKFTQQIHELQEEGDINIILAHMSRLLSHRIAVAAVAAVDETVVKAACSLCLRMALMTSLMPPAPKIKVWLSVL